MMQPGMLGLLGAMQGHAMPSQQEVETMLYDQLESTDPIERIVYAACSKSFKIFKLPPSFATQGKKNFVKNEQAGVRLWRNDDWPTEEQMEEAEEISLDDKDLQVKLGAGAWVVIQWEDPRPIKSDVFPGRERMVRMTGMPNHGQTHPFVFWDGPSIALELFASGLEDPEDMKLIKGNLMYLMTGEDLNHIFWSAIIHYHTTGKCFPDVPEELIKKGFKGLIMWEREKLLDKAGGSLETLRKTKKKPRTQSIALNIWMNGGRKSEMLPIDHCFNTQQQPAAKRKKPAWYRAMEDWLGCPLQKYVKSSCNARSLPCMWVGRIACTSLFIRKPCVFDHEIVTKVMARVIKLYEGTPQQLLEEEQLFVPDKEESGSSTAGSLVHQPISRCNYPSCPTSSAPANGRCTRCFNVHYCSRECQKLDWKEHKQLCRVPDNDDEHECVVVSLIDPELGVTPSWVQGKGFLSRWRSGLKSFTIGNIEPILVPVCHGVGCNEVFLVITPPEATAADVNWIASALITPPGESFATEGPDVKVRGSCTLVRAKKGFRLKKSNKNFNELEDGQLFDSGPGFYSKKFGKLHLKPAENEPTRYYPSFSL